MNLAYRTDKNAHAISAYWKKPLDKPDWFLINNLADDTPEIFIYDVIGWPYNDIGALVRGLAEMKNRTPLVRINSPGGDVWDGMALMNAFASHPGGTTVRIESLAASIASVIAMGGRKVEAYQNAMMMIHNSWICTAGNRIELLEIADILEMVDENIMESYTGKTKIGKKEMREMMRAETWMNAKTMKEKGFIDSILESGKGAKASFDLTIYGNVPDDLIQDTEHNKRKIERALRDVGFSLNSAKAFIARGLKAESEIVEESKIDKLSNILNGGN